MLENKNYSRLSGNSANREGKTVSDKEEKTPNDILAGQVTESLIKAGFVSAAKAAEVLAKVQSGGASSEDWRLWVELAQEEKAKEAANVAS